MNSQHSQVREWLDTIFPNGTPTFEVNEANLAALSELARLSKVRNREIDMLRELADQQADEYEAESQRLARMVLKCSGINALSGPSSLKPVEKFAEVLADVSTLLHVDDPHPLSLRLHMAEVQTVAAAIPARDFTRQTQNKQKDLDRMDALRELSQNQNAFESIENSTDMDQVRHNAKQITFYKQKQAEYVRQIQKLETSLKKCGFAKEKNSHDAITALKAELDVLKEELHPLESTLQSYEELPPNTELALAKVAEAEAELAQLREQLTSEISVLHI